MNVTSEIAHVPLPLTTVVVAMDEDRAREECAVVARAVYISWLLLNIMSMRCIALNNARMTR